MGMHRLVRDGEVTAAELDKAFSGKTGEFADDLFFASRDMPQQCAKGCRVFEKFPQNRAAQLSRGTFKPTLANIVRTARVQLYPPLFKVCAIIH